MKKKVSNFTFERFIRRHFFRGIFFWGSQALKTPVDPSFDPPKFLPGGSYPPPGDTCPTRGSAAAAEPFKSADPFGVSKACVCFVGLEKGNRGGARFRGRGGVGKCIKFSFSSSYWIFNFERRHRGIGHFGAKAKCSKMSKNFQNGHFARTIRKKISVHIFI